MRAEYLFHLGRVCGLKPADVDDLHLFDFQNLTDCIDEWLPIEARMRG
jgi:hypothetical protein